MFFDCSTVHLPVTQVVYQRHGRSETSSTSSLKGFGYPQNHLRRTQDDSGQSEEYRKAVRRAIRQAQDGNVKKASAALETATARLGGVQPPTEDVVRQLREMHPHQSQPAPDLPDGLSIGLPLSRASLRRAGKRVANGA